MKPQITQKITADSADVNLRHRRLRKKGQSVVEYAMLFVIVMAAFVATSSYIKRGIQGRWKQAIDDMGEQYDPTVMNTFVNHSIRVNAETRLMTQNVANGYWTNRYDTSNTIERKTGFEAVGGY